ncbi:MAG: DUF1294 domain-containing protein [Nitrososphaerales archaeon]|jgi:uncharacterized membrane protein YsdA (DUF1294 family)
MSPIGLLTAANLLLWMLIAGFVGFVTMGVDKAMARFGWGGRISERTLWLAAIVGGFVGVIAGALTFRHKTSKGEFWPPVLLALILWMSLLFLVLAGYVQ